MLRIQVRMIYHFLSMKSIECRSSPESIQKFVVPEDIFDAVVNPEL